MFGSGKPISKSILFEAFVSFMPQLPAPPAFVDAGSQLGSKPPTPQGKVRSAAPSERVVSLWVSAYGSFESRILSASVPEGVPRK